MTVTCDIDEIGGASDPSAELDPSSFVTVVRGELPLVISAPHGGTIQPISVPNLTAGLQKGDINTLELAQQLADCIATHLGGKRPFVVSNKLHRKKMDPNRDINTGTEGTSFASSVYDAYHRELKSCCAIARAYNTESEVAVLLDIHGYRAPASLNVTLDTSWVIIGHLVPGPVLRQCSDYELGVDASWIRGPYSLGSLLERQGLLAEPSERSPFPSRDKYFSGGHITKEYRQQGKVETIQLEFPREMRQNLDYVAPRVARAVVDLMHVWNFFP